MHAALRVPARCLDASASGVRTVAMSPDETLPRPLLNDLGGLSMKRNVAERVNSDNTKVRAGGVCAVLDVLRMTSVTSAPITARTTTCTFMTYLLISVLRSSSVMERLGGALRRCRRAWQAAESATGSELKVHWRERCTGANDDSASLRGSSCTGKALGRPQRPAKRLNRPRA